ncbi:MAG: NTP transferase domain-containing protein [Candidatus Thorarchaeota archaeon]|jgi:glucose-1-phosphate thymidylyltransferase
MFLAFEESSRGGIPIHGVILAAGKGERMHPITQDVPKALLQVGDKTLVDWAIERLSKAGIGEIVVAVGWKGDMIEQHLSSTNSGTGIVKVEDYEIGPLQTLVTAIETFDDDFLLTPVDTIIDASVLSGMLSQHSEQNKSGGLTLAVDYVATTGTQVSTTEEGIITGIEDSVSPTDKIGRSAMLFIGNSSHSQKYRAALSRGESKFVSVLGQLVRNGFRVKSYPVDKSSIDIDTLPDLLEANRQVLAIGDFTQSGQIFVPKDDSIEVRDTFSMKSDIILGRGSQIFGPVLISPGCEIGENNWIGPYTAIGPNSKIEKGCEVSDAIIFGESTVAMQSRIQNSIIFNSITHNVER